MLEGLPVPLWVLAAAAAIVILLALLISNAISERELTKRAQRLAEAEEGALVEAPTSPFGAFLGGIGRIGNALRGSFLFAPKDIETIERTARAAGLDPARAVPVVIGGKVMLLFAGPVIGYVLAISWNLGLLGQALTVMIGMALGTFLPNWLLAFAIRSHQDSLRKGLPDALDLLVVCAEAGLGLESALERVAAEMRESNPSIAAEFNTLLSDMRIATDRRAALTRLGERTGLASFQRLGSTLSQTLRYGTPVGQALRVLAAEMRTERMVRIEEKAARLPALLVLPMILFILPCLFIVLGGPAALRILDAVGG
ncbi:type II secretion system F family protein [Falsiroseomonas oryziterrae]|uniref:type II secretion system F family protein n=1 Tax=Falsiroseomonas oryziterrae TaxID=2911368 RepID=UPI001F1CD254|nr:type II secretion system F family protein [Roseomonas sp. NPKOSM-4]